MEEKKAKKAKITVEVEGQETVVYETDRFSLLADLGKETVIRSVICGTRESQVADHLRAIDRLKENIAKEHPVAALLCVKFGLKDTLKDDASEDSAGGGATFKRRRR